MDYLSNKQAKRPLGTGDGVIVTRALLGFMATLACVIAVCSAAALPLVDYPWRFTLIAVSAGGIAAAAVSFRRYYILTFDWQTRSARPEGKAELQVDTAHVRHVAAAMYAHLDEASVVAFVDLVVEPTRLVDRITESVEPLTRSTLVRTTHTISFNGDLAGRSIVVPVHRQAKDQLGAGMRFYSEDGSRLSSLSQMSTLAYVAAVIRLLMYAISKGALKDYIRYFEDEVVSGLAAFPNSTASSHVVSDAFTERLYKLDRFGTRDSKYALSLVERLIAQFVDNRVVCLQVVVPDRAPASPFGTKVRVTSEVRLPPRMRLGGRDETSAARLRRVTNDARRWFGVRPSMVYFRLVNADRAMSYHVQIKGPDGMYLARQELLDALTGEPTDPMAGNYAFSPRQGQRHSHLYVHGGHAFEGKALVNHFYERMPGSMGGATMSATAAALLIWLCALVRLTPSDGPAGPGGTDLVAVLLAFPIIISLWVGVERQSALIGDVMIARVTKIITVTLCAAASYLYVLGVTPELLRTALWIFVAGTAFVNMVICCGSWYLRARVHDHFIRSNDGD